MRGRRITPRRQPFVVHLYNGLDAADVDSAYGRGVVGTPTFLVGNFSNGRDLCDSHVTTQQRRADYSYPWRLLHKPVSKPLRVRQSVAGQQWSNRRAKVEFVGRRRSNDLDSRGSVPPLHVQPDLGHLRDSLHATERRARMRPIDRRAAASGGNGRLRRARADARSRTNSRRVGGCFPGACSWNGSGRADPEGRRTVAVSFPSGRRVYGPRFAVSVAVGVRDVVGVLALVFELSQRAASFGDAAVDGGVAGAGDLHDLAVAVAEALQVQRLAVVGLDRREVLAPLGVLDALGDLVGDVAGVGGRLWVLAALEFTGARGQEGAGGSSRCGCGRCACRLRGWRRRAARRRRWRARRCSAAARPRRSGRRPRSARAER